MPAVQTVTGPVDAGDLGPTLVHEHVQGRDEAVAAQWPPVKTVAEVEPPHEADLDESFELAVQICTRVVELGVPTICDPAAMFLGRDVPLMRRVSEASGLRIIPCTGIYTYDYLPPFFAGRDADAIADLFVHDIEQGIQGTEVKAAFIKCAADEPGITQNIEKVHRAAARASVRTGTPIMAHSRPAGGTGPLQIQIFESEGVDLARVQLAHTGDTDDLDYIERVLDKGVFIGMDRYGLELYLPYERRQETVLTLLERGYADRMMLSADHCATLDWFPLAAAEQLLAAGAAKDWNMALVPEKVLPELRERGMTPDQEETMMVSNPRRWLTGG
jgi:phosphotriesterase-related protein